MVLATLVGCSESSPSGSSPAQAGGGSGGTAGSDTAAGGQATFGGGGISPGGSSGQGGSDPSTDASTTQPRDANGAEASGPDTAVPVVLSDDGGWCWFQSPRAIFHGDHLTIGSLPSGWKDPARKGDVEVIDYNLRTQQTSAFELHDRLELDDHDSAALMIRPDKGLLALYAKHGTENHFYYRVSDPDNALAWKAEQTFVPSQSTLLTYSNLFPLTAENRVYDFYRGLDNSYKPSYAYSDDNGDTWKSGNVVINVPATLKHRPYVRYAFNGSDTVHLIYTEGHPRDYDNNLWHIYYKAGTLYGSAGNSLHPLSQGLTSPDEGTRIFQADPQHVAWGSDVVLDGQGRPYVTYSVQVGSAGLPQGQGGDDIRYRYARWDGAKWNDFALAYAGTRLFSGEDDYSGLASLDPFDPSVVYISTNADPVSGAPLISATDKKRHWEIFRGTTPDAGTTWTWKPITHDSTADNLRPILPPGGDGQRVLLWLRGTFPSFIGYQQEVVAAFWRQ
jgi:BNR repeat-containing family member